MTLQRSHVRAFLAAFLAFGFDALLRVGPLVMADQPFLGGEDSTADLTKMLLQPGFEERIVESVRGLPVCVPDVMRQVFYVRDFQ